MRRLLQGLPIALACLLAPLGAATGQVSLVAPISAYYDWEYDVGIESDYQLATQTDLGGTLSVLRFGGLARAGGPISQNIRVFVDLGYVNADYDFGNPRTAGCSIPAACLILSPWNTIHRVDVAPGVSLVLGDRFHFQMIVPMQWHFESGSEVGSFTGGVIGALRMDLSDRFSATLGVGVQSEIEQAMSVYPVIGLDWQIRDGLALVTRGGPYQGGEGVLIWGTNKAVQLQISVGYEWRRFRLASDAPNPNGVGQYTSVPVLAGVRIQLGRQVDLSFDGGIAAGGRLRLETGFGLPLFQQDFDTAGLFRGQLVARW